MTRRGWAIAGVGLALLAVCGLMAASLYVTVSAVKVSGRSWRLSGAYSAHATERATTAYQVGAQPRLTVDTAAGGITVTAGSDGVIEVETVRTTWRDSTAAARSALESLTVSATQTDDEVLLRYEAPDEWIVLGDGGRRDTVSYNIKVPRATLVTLATSDGPVSLTGTRAAAQLSSRFGDVTATDITGGAALTLASQAGDLLARRGELGQLSLKGDFGDITVDGVTAGEIATRSGNGKILITGSTLRAAAGGDGRLVARNGFGDIEVRGTRAAAYDLETANGALDLEGPTGPLRLHSNFGDLRVTGAREAVLDLASNNGNVDFEGVLAMPRGTAGGVHSATSNFGDVSATLPADSRLDLLLHSDLGSVTSELPVTVVGENAGGNLNGKVNGGGMRLELRTNNGDVRLLRRADSGS